MAAVVAPAPVIDIARGINSLDEDLPRVLRVLGVSSLEELGWTRPNKSTLVLPFEGTLDGVTEQFTLMLGFEAYRRWPPSARFVNPVSLAYSWPLDQQCVPQLRSPECYTHATYALTQLSTDAARLLFCSSRIL